MQTVVQGPLEWERGMDVVAAPGEKPGQKLLHMQAPSAQGGEQDGYITGDLYHHVLEFDEPGRNVAWAEPAAMAASKARLMARAAASSARVYFAHIEGTWGGRDGKWEVRSGK